MTKLCNCTDCHIQAMEARENRNGKWELYTLSNVMGMGHCEHHIKVTDEEYDEIIPLNSCRGTSYIALRKNNLWRLIQLQEDGFLKTKWSIVADFKHANLDAMLEEINILKKDYSIWE